MKVAIIRYNAGNILSVKLALERVGADPVISDDPGVIVDADRVVFPGVGEARSAMNDITGKGLDRIIPSLKTPFLGICLGMQLLCRYSRENDTPCLGVFDEVVERFPPSGKVPHMGWNSIRTKGHPLFEGVREGCYLYFAHSYFAATGKDTISTCEYTVPFSAALQKENFFAVQFHPEKSGEAGEQILRNFLKS